MHRGRSYPYLWQFWATNFTFWPWYVGRRLIFDVPGAAGDDWDVLTLYPGTMLSDVGVVSLSRYDVRYKFTPAEGGWFVTFDLLSDTSDPGRSGIGVLTLVYLDGRFGQARGPVGFGMTQPGEFFFDDIIVGGGFDNFHTSIRNNHQWATWSQGGGS